MTDHSIHTPPGWPTVVPRIFVREVKGLVAFITHVFDADGTYNDERPSEIRIGDSMIMVSSSQARQEMPVFLYVYVEDIDATYQRAIEAGATELEQPAEMPYGDRRAMIEDSWGNTWQIATHRGFTV